MKKLTLNINYTLSPFNILSRTLAFILQAHLEQVWNEIYLKVYLQISAPSKQSFPTSPHQATRLPSPTFPHPFSSRCFLQDHEDGGTTSIQSVLGALGRNSVRLGG